MYEKIAALLEERGITMYRMAKESGISLQVLSHWKHGDYRPSLASLKRVADYFGVTVDSLIG